jgi:formylglycine-generating enzyme required for sulfatase activity
MMANRRNSAWLILAFMLVFSSLGRAQEDSLRSQISAPAIAGLESLTEETALLWWDSVDAKAVKIQLLIGDKSWSAPERRDKVDAKQGWMIVQHLQARRPYRMSLIAFSATNTSSPGPEFTYTHRPPLLDWVWIPADTFEMGSPSGDEAPQHVVQLTPFLFSRTEITNRDYLTFCNSVANPYPVDPDFPKLSGYFYHDHNYPIVNVTWNDAVAYCSWLSVQMRLPSGSDTSMVRLPTEAEWEFAARQSHGKYSWGDAEPTADLANYAVADRHAPVAVKTYPPTSGGLYDLAGNVWEWCLDWYGPYRDNSIVTLNPHGPVDGIFKVVRGGSWGDPAETLKSTDRGKLPPTLGLSTVGFRVARSLPVHRVKVLHKNLTEGDDAYAK